MKKPKLSEISILRRKIIDFVVRIIEFFQSKINNKNLYRLKKIFLSFKAEVIILVEENNWIIEWIGKYISHYLKSLNLIEAEIASPVLSRNKLIHFTSITCLVDTNVKNRLNKTNKYILTWYHPSINSKNLRYIPYINQKIDKIITSSKITKRILIESGLQKNKVLIVPLAVDLNIFKEYDDFKKAELKKKFNLPNSKIIIGSFQKDGVGWGEGLVPKLEKGPDIFCEVVKRLNEKYDIHVFLTGPSRGFVKNRLKEYKISYTHIYLKNYLDIVECYNVLDLYLITSRAEGGPMALLEGIATGVPIITTNVGMVPDIIDNGINGFVTEVENIDQLYKNCIKLLENKELKEFFIKNGLNIIQDFSWENVTKKYYYKIYKKFLKLK